MAKTAKLKTLYNPRNPDEQWLPRTTKEAVGLPNVDNTADMDKPVSTAMQEALSKCVPAEDKGVAGGVATLGADGKIPTDQIPTLDYIPTTQKGTANGLATLGADGILELAQRPTVSGIMSDDGSTTLSTLLANRAPAGYGLGENPVWGADADLCVLSGWYVIGSNCPKPGAWVMRVDAAPDSVYQTAYARQTNSGVPDYVICRRYKAAGANSFSPWEYVNPPMEWNVEYRTIERYDAKPVYKKCVVIGSLPGNGAVTSVSFVNDAENPDSDVIILATVYCQSANQYNNQDIFYVSGGRGGQFGTVYVTNKNANTFSNVILYVEYTKSTD